jgi:hypothetical protein
MRLGNRIVLAVVGVLGPENPNTPETFNALGLLYYHLHRYVEDETLFKHSMAIYETALGSDHPAVANPLKPNRRPAT